MDDESRQLQITEWAQTLRDNAFVLSPLLHPALHLLGGNKVVGGCLANLREIVDSVILLAEHGVSMRTIKEQLERGLKDGAEDDVLYSRRG